ncbi:MAG: protein kinase domain-containing protein [Chitinispirillaceae bacterium]
MGQLDPQDLGRKDLPVKVGSCTIDSLVCRTENALFYSVQNERPPERLVKIFLDRRENGLFSIDTETLLTLNHPNLVRIFSTGLHEGFPFIELERVEGVSLEKITEQRGALPLEVCTAAGILICKALRYLHEQKADSGKEEILHMNLRPSKVLFCDSQGLKLLGTAEKVTQNLNEFSEEKEPLGFFPPEVLFGKDADNRSDIYSLGCLLYQMICGERVFSQTNGSKLYSARRKNRYIPLSRYKLRLRRDLLRLVGKCLEAKSSRRPQSVSAVLEKLEQIHNSFSRHSPRDVIDYLLNATEGHIVVKRRLSHVFPAGVLVGLIVALVLWEANSGQSVFLKKLMGIIRNHSGERLSFKNSEPSGPYVEYRKKKEDSSSDENQSERLEKSEPVDREEEKISKESGTLSENDTVLKDSLIPSDTDQSDSAVDENEEKQKDGGVVLKFEGFIDRMKRLYGTDDLFGVYKDEMAHGRYEKGLALFEMLSSEHKQNKEVLLLKMRALVVLRRGSELEEFFEEYVIDDKEYYFAKGQFFFEKKKYGRVLDLMKKCRSTIARYSDSHELDKRAAFYLARCNTVLYERNPEESSRKRALNSWFDVKYLYRNDRAHPNFLRAEEEIRRLSKVNAEE